MNNLNFIKFQGSVYLRAKIFQQITPQIQFSEIFCYFIQYNKLSLKPKYAYLRDLCVYAVISSHNQFM